MYSPLLKSISILLVLSGLAFNVNAQKIDSKIVAQANCSQDLTLSPEEASFRVMEMSRVLTRKQLGEVSVYSSLPDPDAGFMKVYGAVVSRVTVVTKRGLPFAVVGATFEKEAKIKDMEILEAYAKGLKKDFVMAEIQSPILKSIPDFQYAAMSSVSVSDNDKYLLMVSTSKGSRTVFCAPKALLTRILF